jgi:hypothetical protein
VKTRLDDIGYLLYCDAGPHDGGTRIGLMLRLHWSPLEYARYQGPLVFPGYAAGVSQVQA